MAENEGLCKTGNAWVVCIEPDVCKTPIGDEMKPVPYQIRACLAAGVDEATTVRLGTFDTATMASRITTVQGDEPGTGGGVKSGVNLGYCRPVTHSTTVHAGGANVTYHTSLYAMNCAGPDGPENTFGKAVFMAHGLAPYAGPLVDLNKMREEAEKSWWEKASDWVHTGLDIVGFIPGLGEIADGLNAAIYLAEGDYLNAAISAAGMIPFGGAAATGGRLAAKAGKAVAEAVGKEGAQEAAQQVGKQGAEQLGKQGAEQAGKEGAEKAGKEGAEKAGKEGAEKAGKEGAEKAGKEGAEKAGKEGAEKAGKEGAEKAGKEGAEKAGKEGAEKAGKKGADDAAGGGAKKPKKKGNNGVVVKGTPGKGSKAGGGKGRPKGPKKRKNPSKKPARDQKCVGDPVDVATGEVVNQATDISLPGIIPLVIERQYASSCCGDRDAALGPGWAHSLEEWIEEGEETLDLHDGEGRWLYFDKVGAGEATFHRGERLELRVGRDGSYRVYDLESRIARVFAGPGRKALLRSIEDANGNAITLEYDDELLSRVVDTTGREVLVRWDRGRLVRLDVCVDGHIEQSVEYRYSKGGNLSAVVDALGNAEEYEYDGADQMIAVRRKSGARFQYAYDDETGRCVRTWGPDGLHEVELYADERTQTTRAESEEPKIYTWNDEGLVTREETTTGVVLEEREYDEDGFLVEERDGAGNTTRFERDERGNLVRVVDPAGNVTAWTYEGDLPVQRTGPDGLETRYTHDARGKLIEIQYPTGVTYKLSYDGRGLLCSIEGPDGPVMRYEYDARHNVIAETDARGARTTFEYDALGRPVSMTDALGRVTRLAYDRLGRPIEIHRPDGTVARQAYDAQGNVTRVTDALGHVTAMEYAGTGVLTRITQSDGHTWSFRYTSMERLREIENSRGEVYAFTYDVAARVVEELTFDGRTLKYDYSKAGNLSRIDYPDGSFRAFNHDRLGNVVFEQSTDGITTYLRDALGRLTTAVVEEGERKIVTMFERDKLGRIVTEWQGDKAVRFEYDALGRRAQRVLPNGATTTYVYDALDALIAVEHDGYRMEIERDVLGREVWRGRPDEQVSIQSGYDAMDRLIEQRVSASAPGTEIAKSLVERKWSYDALGRVTRIEEGRWGATTYRYDRIDQLLEAQRGSLREVFAYDAAGSLQKMVEGLGAQAASPEWDIAPGNLLRQTGKSKYTYDKRGRRIVKLDLGTRTGGAEGAATEYTWDCRDRLREVRRPDGTQVRFSYDAFGRRVRKEVVPAGAETAGRAVEFVWDGDALAADLERTRGVRVFVNEPGTFVPLLQAEQGQVFAVVNDHLGMPKELVNPDGRVAWSAAHSAWGRVVDVWRDPGAQHARSVESPFRLLGQYADEETGLCYTRFRYFDPDVGRWCSPDPLGIRGDRNLHQYGIAPTVGIDPWGLRSESGNGGNRRSCGNARQEVSRDAAEDTLETGRWNQGSFDSPADSLRWHFNKHGAEVGASTVDAYLRKAEGFATNLRRAQRSTVRGRIDGVVRYKKDGKYIDMAPDGSIISYGKQ
ncbi:PAAR-like domain-containing protein [Sorangium sp. So ce394]|uniref:PAAR-like domain-containing protein n=1 Tax=Sorangium sp. So ce394 TaxID=3133310 RepID=UPI003F5B3CBD